MAWILKRGNTWQAVWRNAAGEQVRKSTNVHVTPTARDGGMTARELKKLAERVADGMEQSAKGGLSVELAVAAVRAAAIGGKAKPITVGEFADEFLAEKRSQKSFNNTETAVKSLLRLLPGIGELPLTKVTKAMADDYIGAALDEVSGSTVDRRLEALSSMFNRARDKKLIEENPFRGCRVPKWALNDAREREPFTRDETRMILQKLPGEWPDMVSVCLLMGGLRLSDVACLRWESVDFARGLVQISDNKNNKPHRKPLIKPLRFLLERRKKTAGDWSEFVFPYAQLRYAQAGDKSSKLSIEFTKLLIEHGIVERAKVEEKRSGKARRFQTKTFHSLRTTATTFLLDCGCPAELVRHIIGHDDANIERHHYYKPTSETQQGYLAQLAELLGVQVDG